MVLEIEADRFGRLARTQGSAYDVPRPQDLDRVGVETVDRARIERYGRS